MTHEITAFQRPAIAVGPIAQRQRACFGIVASFCAEGKEVSSFQRAYPGYVRNAFIHESKYDP